MSIAPSIAPPSTDALSKQGKGAFLVSLILIFSTNAEWRVNIAGLLVHPYLLLAPLVAISAGYRLLDFPSRYKSPLILFWVFYAIAQVVNGSPTEIFKVAATVFTLLFFFQAVHRDNDLKLISIGLIVVAIYVGSVALQIALGGGVSRLAGINALEGIGNKNAQSLFTLPGFFYCILFFEKAVRKRKVLEIMLYIVALIIITLGILYSANRSGWVGAIVIVLALIVRNGLTIRSVILGSLILFIGGYLAMNFAEDIIVHKLEQTTEGYSSDTKRQHLIREGLLIGLENPVLGLGHDGLHEELPKRVHQSANARKFDTHNLIAYIFGSSGAITFTFFLVFVYRVFFLPKLPRGYQGAYAKEYREAVFMVKAYIVLFLVRSIFTREILYSPTFLAGLGIALGYWYSNFRNIITINRQRAE